MAFANLDWGSDWLGGPIGSQADSELPPLLPSDGREEWARRVRGLHWLERQRPNQQRVVRISRLQEECLDWIVAQDLDVDESEKLGDKVLRISGFPSGVSTVALRYFAHPCLARFCLMAAALEVGRKLKEERPGPLLSVFTQFEVAAPLDAQRACSVFEVNSVLSRLGRRPHRRCMRILRPHLARAAEVIADQAALDTREGVQQVDFALSFLLRHRHDAIAHRLLAQLEAREDLTAARSESMRMVRWSIALARCRTAGRALDREEFQRQLARAVEQLSPAFSPVQRSRLGRMRLHFLEPYVRADADAFGLAELWSEYAALIPDHPPASVWIDLRSLRRRRRWRRRPREDVDSNASDTSSTS